MAKPQTGNVQAYTFYLKGREYYYRYRSDDNENAITLFKRALGLDPTYALAYAGLGDAYGQRVQRFGFPTKWLDSAIAASQKSVTLDANLAEGYKALALAYHLKGKNTLALANNQKAAALNPNYFPAVSNVGYVLQTMGRPDEAIPWMKKALSVNPAFPITLSLLGGLYAELESFDEARKYASRSLELEPDLFQSHWILVQVDALEGKHDQANARCQKLLSIAPNDPISLFMAGYYYFWIRDFKTAAPLLERASSMSPPESRPNNELACIYLTLGRTTDAETLLKHNIEIQTARIADRDESRETRVNIAASCFLQGNKTEGYRWLHEAVERGFLDYSGELQSPSFDSVRDDKEFKEIIAGLKTKVTQLRLRAEQLEKD
jgi:tetratricopeptide (TPR) repeat protein